MKTYELIAPWQGLPAGLQIFGPLPLIGSSGKAYFTKENIPPQGNFGDNGFFASAVENNPDIFKLISDDTNK